LIQKDWQEAGFAAFPHRRKPPAPATWPDFFSGAGKVLEDPASDRNVASRTLRRSSSRLRPIKTGLSHIKLNGRSYRRFHPEGKNQNRFLFVSEYSVADRCDVIARERASPNAGMADARLTRNRSSPPCSSAFS
jgi:hypothetical protein